MDFIRESEESLKEALYDGKVIILYGARQVGKTTLAKKVLSELSDGLYLTCDEPDVRAAFSGKSSSEMYAFLEGARVVVIDEAQRVEDIGLSLKLLHDRYPQLKIIATGSSSFDLTYAAAEPLTGRNRTINLYPVSWSEYRKAAGEIESRRLIEERLKFGMYPAVINAKNPQREIKTIARDYLFKDILNTDGVRRPIVLEKLTQLLAYQVGQLVSYNELAQKLEVSRLTVMAYVHLLEKAFIIFRVSPLGNNPRSEITRFEKIYFCDTGIRNALIGDFSPMEFRYDKGSLFENFFISERLKYYMTHNLEVEQYFWRTRDGSEIDLVEREGSEIQAFECKWSGGKIHTRAWNNAFPDVKVNSVNRSDFWEWL